MSNFDFQATRERWEQLSGNRPKGVSKPSNSDLSKSDWFGDIDQGEGERKSYKDIVGVEHPDGEFFFTRGKAWFELEDWEERDHLFIPFAEDILHIDHDYALAVLNAWEDGEAVFAYGPPGTGKTVTPRHLASLCNRPYVSVSGFAGSEPADYVGTVHIRNGDTKFIPGLAAVAVERGYTLMYDEVYKSSADTNMWMQALLDDQKRLTLYGHENPEEATMTAHERFRMCMTDNVRGVGDGLGKYAAEIQDQSTMDRVKYKAYVDYLHPEQEENVLKQRYPDAKELLVKSIVQMANEIRESWKKGDTSIPFSNRQSQNFVDVSMKYRDPAKAFKAIYFNTLPDDDECDAIRTLFNKSVDFTPFKL